MLKYTIIEFSHSVIMQIITCASLSGGQGKTTIALCLGKLLNQRGHSVLMVDSDAQASLTFYLGHEIEPDQPSLLEAIKKEVKVEDAIYEIAPHLWLIPADDGLDKAQEYLSSSGMGAVVLGKRLSEVADLFDFCIIDAPPQRNQLALTSIGAADYVILPAEASSKGVNSLIRTLQAIYELQDVGAFRGKILGILPFRDRWMGLTQAKQSQKSIEAMKEIATDITLFPSLLESEQFKKSLDQNKLPSELGHPKLEYPFVQIVETLINSK
jgi:chromosome partitioning protein